MSVIDPLKMFTVITKRRYLPSPFMFFSMPLVHKIYNNYPRVEHRGTSDSILNDWKDTLLK